MGNIKQFKTFGERLKELREKSGENQNKIAGVLGISSQMVSKLELGKSKPSMESLKKLAAHFNVSVEYLLGLTQNTGREEEMLPLLGEISAGLPIYARENIIDYLPKIPGAIGDFYLIVKGKSMEPGIVDKNVVLVKETGAISIGMVGVFIVRNNETVIKRFYEDRYGVILRSDNPAFSPLVVERKIWNVECRIIGKVTKQISDVV